MAKRGMASIFKGRRVVSDSLEIHLQLHRQITTRMLFYCTIIGSTSCIYNVAMLKLRNGPDPFFSAPLTVGSPCHKISMS